MPFALVRALPWLTAVLGFFLAQEQWRDSTSYPWPLVSLFALFLVSAISLRWRREGILDAVKNILPTCLVLFACGLAFLMVEEPIGRWILSFAVAIIPCITLELLYVSAHEPARYPVNGLSRWNLVLVPITACCIALSLNGFFVFLRQPLYIAPISFALIGSLLFGLTSHPSADTSHRRRWVGIGALVGLHVGVLTVLLPIATAVHGALAAIVFSIPLRIRRYAYAPVPAKSIAVSEGVLVVACLFVLLFVSRWA